MPTPFSTPRRTLLAASALVAALVAAGCSGAGSSPAPRVVTFTAVELPAGAQPVVLSVAGDSLLIGIRRPGQAVVPGVLRRSADGTTTELPVHGVSPYGVLATWQSIAASGDRLVALGGERGGAHGHVRWSVWSGSTAAGLTERVQGFSVFGGYEAGDLVDLVQTPAGPAVVGAWASAKTGFDVAVWTTDGETWTRQSSAGTALESTADSLGFPQAAAPLQGGVAIAGWRLALDAGGRQLPVVWRSSSGITGWTRTELPDSGKAGETLAIRCWPGSGSGDGSGDGSGSSGSASVSGSASSGGSAGASGPGDGCAVSGRVDGALAVWRLDGGIWARVPGAPGIAVSDRERLTAPVEVDGQLVQVIADGGQVKIARTGRDGWTASPAAGPSGKVTAVTRIGDSLYVLAGPDESSQTLWRTDLAH